MTRLRIIEGGDAEVLDIDSMPEGLAERIQQTQARVELLRDAELQTWTEMLRLLERAKETVDSGDTEQVRELLCSALEIEWGLSHDDDPGPISKLVTDPYDTGEDFVDRTWLP